jgi:hypothetical protein
MIPASVATLTSRSFRRRDAVEILEFERGSQLAELPRHTFRNCTSLKSICIPSSVLRIARHCFSKWRDPDSSTRCPFDLPLQAVIFESGSKLRVIESFAFYGCSRLKSIRLPASLEIADGSSFCECGLTEIEIESGSEYFVARPPFVVDVSGIRILRYAGEDSQILIPDGIEILGGHSFCGCQSIISVEFTANCHISWILEQAFRRCVSLSSICIPPSVTHIGKWSFSDCANLETVTFCRDSQLRTIRRHAFSSCSLLKSMLIPSSVTSVGLNAFCGCDSLLSFRFVLPSQVRTLGDVPEKVTDIPDSVERLRFFTGRKKRIRQSLRFGADSRLVRILVLSARSAAIRRCFLLFSTRTLKLFRSRFDF